VPLGGWVIFSRRRSPRNAAVLRRVDGVGGRAQDPDSGRLEPLGELQGRLAAELHDHAEGRSSSTISSTSSNVSGSK